MYLRAQKELEKSKPGNERIRMRAFQRALLHSERITDEKVTALQRQRDFRKFSTLSIRIQ